MSHGTRLDRNRILDLWAQNKTAPEIAAIIGHPHWRSVSVLICRERANGDPRAAARASPTSRKSGKTCAIRPAPAKRPLHKILGIKTRVVRVMIPSHTSNAETYVYVTLPSLGRFDPPEMEAR